jgi:hypothetical protein
MALVCAARPTAVAKPLVEVWRLTEGAGLPTCRLVAVWLPDANIAVTSDVTCDEVCSMPETGLVFAQRTLGSHSLCVGRARLWVSLRGRAWWWCGV